MEDHEGWDSSLFVDDVDDADMCGICSEVLEDAIETPCGHAYCYQCLKSWTSKKAVCPMDQEDCNFSDCRPMIRDRRRILGLKVNCEFDCGTTMELGKYREHRRECSEKPAGWVEPPIPPNEEDEQKKKGGGGAANAEEEFELELEIDEAPAAAVGAAAAAPVAHMIVEDEDAKLARQLQMEEANRARALTAQRQQQQQQQQRRKSQQPHARQDPYPDDGLLVVAPLELAPADDPPGYYDNGFGEGEGARGVAQPNRNRAASRAPAGGAGRPRSQSQRVRSKSQARQQQLARQQQEHRCCGCNDKMWCCVCTIFWAVIIAAVILFVMYGGYEGALAAIGIKR